MPVSTDNPDWEQQSEQNSMKEDVRDYLRGNPDKAFTIRELADELLITDWETFNKRQEKIEELGEDEFYDRVHNGDFPELERETAKTANDGDVTDILFTVVDTLVDEDEVVVKYLGGEYNPVPGNDSEVEYFSWNNNKS